MHTSSASSASSATPDPTAQPPNGVDGKIQTAADFVPEGNGRKQEAAIAKQIAEQSPVGGSYVRHQHEESYSNQQLECRQLAQTNQHSITPEHEYADQAVSGTKRHRDGLVTMLRAAEAGEFNVLYICSLSRLARESVIALLLLKLLVRSYGVRVISVTEGIDSDRDGWEVIATT